MERSLLAILKEHGVHLRPRRFLTVCVKCNGKIGEVLTEEER